MIAAGLGLAEDGDLLERSEIVGDPGFVEGLTDDGLAIVLVEGV